MFVEWIEDHDEGGTLGDDFDARQADTTPKIFPRGQFASWPSNRLAGAPIIDPIMVGGSKATLIAWSKSPGVSPPLSTYGTDPQDLVPVWSTRDGVMLYSFSIWWNASGNKPALSTTASGNPAQIVLDQEHSNALAAWAGGSAGGQQIPNLPVPQPQGGLPIPPPPGWPSSVPWPVAAPSFWPQGLPWPPLATATPPAGWPSQWPWPPSPSNPIPGVPWPPPGWPTSVPLPIPLPSGWGSPPAQPGLPTPPVQPTLPSTPTQPTLPTAPSSSAPAKKSNTLLWIGGGIAAAIAAVMLSK